jgi:hypothetical protein
LVSDFRGYKKAPFSILKLRVASMLSDSPEWRTTWASSPISREHIRSGSQHQPHGVVIHNLDGQLCATGGSANSSDSLKRMASYRDFLRDDAQWTRSSAERALGAMSGGKCTQSTTALYAKLDGLEVTHAMPESLSMPLREPPTMDRPL